MSVLCCPPGPVSLEKEILTSMSLLPGSIKYAMRLTINVLEVLEGDCLVVVVLKACPLPQAPIIPIVFSSYSNFYLRKEKQFNSGDYPLTNAYRLSLLYVISPV